MRNTFTHLFSALLGLLSYLLLSKYPWYLPFINSASAFLIKFSFILFLFVFFFSFSAAVASFFARRDIGHKVLINSFFWGFLTTLVLCAFAAVVFFVFPVSLFNNSAASVTSSFKFADLFKILFSNWKNLPFSPSSFGALIIIAFFTGFAFRPTSVLFKDAYSFINSMSEVVFRTCKDLSKFWWLIVFVFSANWASNLPVKENALTVSFSVFKILFLFFVIAVFGLIPLLYCLFTRFKKNPYAQMLRLSASVLPAFFSSNPFTSTATLYATERNNLGLQKRVVSLAIPFNAVFARGGCAAISTIVVCSILYPQKFYLLFVLYVSLLCAFFSLFCFISPGLEVFSVSYLVLNVLGLADTQTINTLIVFLPVFNSLSLLTDVLLSGMSASVLGINLNAGCNIGRKDMI